MDTFSHALLSGKTGSSFRWEFVMVGDDGSEKLVCEITGKRIA